MSFPIGSQRPGPPPPYTKDDGLCHLPKTVNPKFAPPRQREPLFPLAVFTYTVLLAFLVVGTWALHSSSSKLSAWLENGSARSSNKDQKGGSEVTTGQVAQAVGFLVSAFGLVISLAAGITFLMVLLLSRFAKQFVWIGVILSSVIGLATGPVLYYETKETTSFLASLIALMVIVFVFSDNVVLRVRLSGDMLAAVVAATRPRNIGMILLAIICSTALGLILTIYTLAIVVAVIPKACFEQGTKSQGCDLSVSGQLVPLFLVLSFLSGWLIHVVECAFQAIQGTMIAATMRTNNDPQHESFMPAAYCCKLAFWTHFGSVSLAGLIITVFEWIASCLRSLTKSFCGCVCNCIFGCILKIIEDIIETFAGFVLLYTLLSGEQPGRSAKKVKNTLRDSGLQFLQSDLMVIAAWKLCCLLASLACTACMAIATLSAKGPDYFTDPSTQGPAILMLVSAFLLGYWVCSGYTSFLKAGIMTLTLLLAVSIAIPQDPLFVKGSGFEKKAQAALKTHREIRSKLHPEEQWEDSYDPEPGPPPSYSQQPSFSQQSKPPQTDSKPPAKTSLTVAPAAASMSVSAPYTSSHVTSVPGGELAQMVTVVLRPSLGLRYRLPSVGPTLMSLRDDRSFYTKETWITTDTGNKVSRKCTICGSQNIILGGKAIIEPAVIIRGDLRRTTGGHNLSIQIGKYCLLGEASVLRPPYKTYKGTFSFYPIKVGDYVTIGAGSVVEAASIGNMVQIGQNCVIGALCIIRDCVKIEDGAVVAPGTTMPSFCIYAGSPAVCVGELPESSPELIEYQAKKRYDDFQQA